MNPFGAKLNGSVTHLEVGMFVTANMPMNRADNRMKGRCAVVCWVSPCKTVGLCFETTTVVYQAETGLRRDYAWDVTVAPNGDDEVKAGTVCSPLSYLNSGMKRQTRLSIQYASLLSAENAPRYQGFADAAMMKLIINALQKQLARGNKSAWVHPGVDVMQAMQNYLRDMERMERAALVPETPLMGRKTLTLPRRSNRPSLAV